MSGPVQRQYNAGALLLAAVAAPPISLWLFMIVGAVVEGGLLSGAWSFLPQLFFFTLLITVWGLIPAGAFGGLGLFVFERLRAGRHPPRWVFAASGAGAASIYVATGLTLAIWAPPVALLIAPWSVALRHGRDEIPLTAMPPTEWAGVIAAIVVAGALAGLIYERGSRRPRSIGERGPSAFRLAEDEPN